MEESLKTILVFTKSKKESLLQFDKLLKQLAEEPCDICYQSRTLRTIFTKHCGVRFVSKNHNMRGVRCDICYGLEPALAKKYLNNKESNDNTKPLLEHFIMLEK